MSSFDEEEEPTIVSKVFRDFERKIQSGASRSLALSSSSASGHRSSFLAQNRLQFNDSVFRSPAHGDSSRRLSSKRPFDSTSLAGLKQARLDHEQTLELSGKKRFPTMEEFEALKKDLDHTKMALITKEAECLEAVTAGKNWESLVSKMELNLKQKDVEHEAALQLSKRDNSELRQKILDLESKVSNSKARYKREDDEAIALRHQSLEGLFNLEERYSEVIKENSQLQEKLAELHQDLQQQIHESDENRFHFEQTIFDLQGQLKVAEDRERLLASQIEAGSERMQEMEKMRQELDRANLELSRLKEDSRLNADFSQQRRVMHAQLSRYPKLLEENADLKRQNQLLLETAENENVLKEQIESLERDLARARADIVEGEKSRQFLLHAEKRVREWERAFLQVLSPQERLKIGGHPESVSVDLLLQKAAHWQQEKLVDAEHIGKLKASLAETQAKLSEEQKQTLSLKMKIQTENSKHAETANFVRKLKRKLLLVSKERDSYKSLLASYEKELTITGAQLDEDRTAALAKTIEDHQAVIEDLEQQLAAAKSSSGSQSETSSASQAVDLVQQLNSLQEKLRKVEDERDEIQMEMERRSLRGDYNPTTTRVLHFKDNPVQQAQDNIYEKLTKLQSDNKALKTRLQLLEDGQTKDLTMIVGQKMEEGISEQEFNDLKEKLRSCEKQRESLVKAFKQASNEFREVCCQFTGYRIDKLNEQEYKLFPVYAETQNDYFLIKRDPSGQCHLMETSFLDKVKDLAELHLKRQHSIPVFCSAVIFELFSQQSIDTVRSIDDDDDDDDDDHHDDGGEHHEDDDDQVEEEEMEEEGGEEEEEESPDEESGEAPGAGFDDDPICIDSD